ncbi:MAG TPA: SDR family NAD(P)-dependent oxidoreductase, partial [Gemmatimonadaceae bacterium]|nr:SDR family NAD(P)-dependent oxidoreductase [Gemmatimonadaceae bacterium]
MAQFSGRAAFVTGAASGIGSACASALAAEGATVWCTDLTADGAAETARRIVGAGGRASALALDVTDEASWE